MEKRKKCRATTRQGTQCRIPVTGRSGLCHIHKQASQNKRRLTKDELAARDARLALILSSGLALIQLVEKVLDLLPFNFSGPQDMSIPSTIASDALENGRSAYEAWDLASDYASTVLDDSEFDRWCDTLLGTDDSPQ